MTDPNSQEAKKTKKMDFFSILKTLFMILIILQFAPMIFTNLRKYFKDIIVPKTQVGQLTLKGMIADSSFYVKKINKFLKDPEIKALLLKIDSPGGLPGSSQAIFNEINKFKKEKPVVVLVENVCASGAYYVACASSYIIATPSALIGSVGVLMQLPNVKDLMENWKIRFKYIQSGKYKTAGSPLKDWTPEELVYLQELADQNYEQFTKDVAQSRNLELKNLSTWADGKVFLGVQALKLKLIDEIGTYQQAVDQLKKLAKIETEIKFVHPKKPISWMQFLKGDEDDDSSESSDFSSKTANFLHSVYTKFLVKEAESEIKLS
jgi:protease IV